MHRCLCFARKWNVVIYVIELQSDAGNQEETLSSLVGKWEYLEGLTEDIVGNKT